MTGEELYDVLWKAYYDAPPLWRHRVTAHWVMSLEWYKAVRRTSLPPDADDEDKDESKWEPDLEDRVLGCRITVTEGGGTPHLVDNGSGA